MGYVMPLHFNFSCLIVLFYENRWFISIRRTYISQDQEGRECISNYITLLNVHEIQPSDFTGVKYAWRSRYRKVAVMLMSP